MPEIRKQDVDKLQSLHRVLGEILTRLVGLEVVLPPEVAARVDARRKAGQCLLCGEKIEGRQTRGMDISCYNKTVNRISKGEITESEVIENGWMLAELAKKGRKSAKPDPMADAMASSSAVISAADRQKIAEDANSLAEKLESEKRSKKRKAKKRGG